jgi:hypothetical protein
LTHLECVRFQIQNAVQAVDEAIARLTNRDSDELPHFGGQRQFYEKTMNRIRSSALSLNDAECASVCRTDARKMFRFRGYRFVEYG